ncbi:MAG: hypothetical protein KDA89_07340, partial [Planctomycetaceae bacterium]|nr:hypothetical protein [Planctomycetaceae bacterium]
MSATAVSTTEDSADLRNRYRGVRFTVRSDLRFSRQWDHGQPCYIVQDPVSFRTHRLTLRQYEIFTALNARQNLGDNFDRLEAKGVFTPDEQELFQQLVTTYSGLGLIILLGIPDTATTAAAGSAEVRNSQRTDSLVGGVAIAGGIGAAGGRLYA